MFTGLVSNTGVLIKLDKSSAPILTIKANFQADIKIGDSIAVNGACLTVISIEQDIYRFNLSAETLKISNFADLIKGTLINLELPLKLNDFLDGHIVSGHLDGTVRVKNIQKKKDSTRLTFVFQEREWNKYIINKGSVCLNGVSLTVSEKGVSYFSVDIIPHTLDSTNLKLLKKGERVNVEFDTMAKYVYNILKNK